MKLSSRLNHIVERLRPHIEADGKSTAKIEMENFPPHQISFPAMDILPFNIGTNNKAENQKAFDILNAVLEQAEFDTRDLADFPTISDRKKYARIFADHDYVTVATNNPRSLASYFPEVARQAKNAAQKLDLARNDNSRA